MPSHEAMDIVDVDLCVDEDEDNEDDLGNDADAEASDGNNRNEEEDLDDEEGNDDPARPERRSRDWSGAAGAAWGVAAASMPGTPDHAASGAAAGKEYASESEARWMFGGGGRRRGRGRGHHRNSAQRRRENWVERAWEMRRSIMRDRDQNRNQNQIQNENRDGGGELLLLQQQQQQQKDGRSGMCMDLEEVKACRDLGLGLPPDWTVELPYGLSGGETSSGGNSPSTSWRISSPGDDPREVKARLRTWAQAVVLASASHLQD